MTHSLYHNFAELIIVSHLDNNNKILSWWEHRGKKLTHPFLTNMSEWKKLVELYDDFYDYDYDEDNESYHEFINLFKSFFPKLLIDRIMEKLKNDAENFHIIKTWDI